MLQRPPSERVPLKWSPSSCPRGGNWCRPPALRTSVRSTPLLPNSIWSTTPGHPSALGHSQRLVSFWSINAVAEWMRLAEITRVKFELPSLPIFYPQYFLISCYMTVSLIFSIRVNFFIYLDKLPWVARLQIHVVLSVRRQVKWASTQKCID